MRDVAENQASCCMGCSTSGGEHHEKRCRAVRAFMPLAQDFVTNNNLRLSRRVLQHGSEIEEPDGESLAHAAQLLELRAADLRPLGSLDASSIGQSMTAPTEPDLYRLTIDADEQKESAVEEDSSLHLLGQELNDFLSTAENAQQDNAARARTYMGEGNEAFGLEDGMVYQQQQAGQLAAATRPPTPDQDTVDPLPPFTSTPSSPGRMERAELSPQSEALASIRDALGQVSPPAPPAPRSESISSTEVGPSSTEEQNLTYSTTEQFEISNRSMDMSQSSGGPSSSVLAGSDIMDSSQTQENDQEVTVLQRNIDYALQAARAASLQHREAKGANEEKGR